ncbi:MAG: hypothetical protein U0838_05510 [Chloroflexota bacterium]
MYLPIAVELANDRTREAKRRALVTEARRAALGVPNAPRRPNRARSLIALPVRALSDASHAVSEVACTAATRIEGQAR